MKTGTADSKPARAVSMPSNLAIPQRYFDGVADVLGRLPIALINEFVGRLFQAYLENRSVYVFGNGGSAALASHCACDLNKGTTIDGKRHFRVLSLTDNVPLITAWANDANYEDIFSAQLRPLIQANDIAMAISGSGNSPNVLSALRVAREVGAITLGLGGYTGGKMAALCDVCVVAPSDNMQQIEDAHLCIMHALFLALANLIRNSSVTLRA